jgi:ubiquinone/menaquinone biosynthesis C-methylase UbiE
MSIMNMPSYIIRGGEAGRERLRVLARVTWPTTRDLFARAGLREGLRCLDVGCGGGDLSRDLARLVGPRGRVVGFDVDTVKLAAARDETAAAGITNVEFHAADVVDGELPAPGFDLVYARFLLTHLREPQRAVERLCGLLSPGGLMIVEDIDYSGSFSHPESWAMSAYVSLYRRAALARGVDPDIGPRLPGLLESAGLAPAAMHVVQPAGLRGEVKLMSALTMAAIADAVVAAGLATAEEIGRVVDELYRVARDETTVLSAPRIVQAWGRKRG